MRVASERRASLYRALGPSGQARSCDQTDLRVTWASRTGCESYTPVCMSELGVAIFGAGRAGHGHARAIEQTPDARLVAVFDVDRARADSFAETHGCRAFTSSDEVLRLKDVDLVMVALPNFLHERATIEAASAG